MSGRGAFENIVARLHILDSPDVRRIAMIRIDTLVPQPEYGHFANWTVTCSIGHGDKESGRAFLYITAEVGVVRGIGSRRD